MRQLIAITDLLLLATLSYGQRIFTRDLWLNESGTPVSVHSLTIDKNGFLWLATDEGLVRFNGREFSTIPDSSSSPATAVTAIDDLIYCGYADGHIACFSDDRYSRLQFGGASPQSRINALSFHSGMLWACTDAEGVFAFPGNTGYCIDMRRGLSDNYVYGTVTTGAGQLLAATDKGINLLHYTKDGKLGVSVFDARNGLKDNIVSALAATPANRDIVWGGLQSGGILRLRAKEGFLEWLTASEHWEWGQVNHILPLSTERAWVVTDLGYLVDCRSTRQGSFDTKAYQIAGKRIRSISKDRSGSLWCATNEGLTVSAGDFLSYAPLEPPYQLSGLTAMSCDRRNNLLYAQGSLIYQYSPGSVKAPEVVVDVHAPVTCLYHDTADRLWIGSLGAGLWCRENGAIRTMKDIPGLSGGHILDIAGVGSTLWVSSLNGVEEITLKNTMRAEPLRITHHSKHTGIGSDYVYQVFPNRKGNIWLATDGAGVCMWDGSRYHHWDSSEGFPGKVVYSITEDNAGRIWVATRNEGLYVLNGGKWRQLDKAQGLTDRNIVAIAANNTGQVLVVHAKGIDEWYPRSQQFRRVNRRLGIGLDSQSNALNGYATDDSGNVWLPFEHGMLCFHNVQDASDLHPGVQIRDVRLFLKQIPAGRHHFSAEENHLSFRFEGAGAANPERLVYRYRLKGFDTTWVVTNDETVTFPLLPHGNYTFQVQASFNNSFIGARSAEYQFTIASPLWRKWWAVMLWLLIVSGVIFWLMRFRVRQLQRKAALQRERMLAEYEQLKSQVNPHFLFNCLNTLASLIEEDGPRAVHYTLQLSDLYRSMLSYRDKDLIPLGEELALLDKYIYIQQSRFPDCLLLHKDIPEQLLQTARVVPLALQLLAENAIKHNIATASQPLHIYLLADSSTLTIRNNLRPKMSKEPGEGLGLANISRRYALLSNQAVVFSARDSFFTVSIPLL